MQKTLDTQQGLLVEVLCVSVVARAQEVQESGEGAQVWFIDEWFVFM